MQEWATQLGWGLRVLKPSGYRHWTVGSDRQPPKKVMGWDGQAVLAVPADHGSRPKPVVHSGRMPSAAFSSAPSHAGAQEGTDPWLHNDPWRQARRGPSPATGSDAVNQPPPTAQIEVKLHQQDTRMQALEADVRALREEQHAARQADKAAFAQDMEAVKSQMGCLARDVADQLKTSVHALQESQQRQQQQMQSSLEELKSLFLQSPALPRKQRKEDEGQL